MTPLEALQAALAGEHAALYLYGVVGGRVSRSDHPALSNTLYSAYAVHRARRDQVELLVRELGGTPVAADLAYEHGPVGSLDEILAETRGIEARCAEVYAQAIASTTGPQRGWAVEALTDAAVRGLSFGGQAEAFPGLPER